MSSILEEVKVQLHLWPWSIDISEESIDLIGGNIEFSYYGSPVITISEDTELFLPSRMECFRPLGCPYGTGYQAYETPHGILTGQKDSKALRVHSAQETFDISFNALGAAERYTYSGEDNKTRQDSPNARFLLAWSQVFDDLLDGAHKARGNYTSEIMWSEVIDFLNKLKDESAVQPRMAIIVRIAQEFRKRLPDIVMAARRILLRERELVPIHQIQESDTNCLRWYIRQPGVDMATKAGHKQRLLGVVRRETCNTLENKVLKDFLFRCSIEALRYLQSDVSSQHMQSSRAIVVKSFKNICNTYSLNPIFEGVSKPSPGVQPNYVLQNDIRYRDVWNWYCKLLKHENAEDNLWDWQTRTWNDVMRLLIGAALELQHVQTKTRLGIRDGFIFEPLVNAPFNLTVEQEMGCRLVADSLPGPFQITRIVNGKHKEKMILELVHPDIAKKHQIVQNLGEIGGHLYMVLHPLGSNNIQKNILIFWGVNGAGVEQGINIKKMARSAYNALQEHIRNLSRRRRECPMLKGMIIASTLHEEARLSFMKRRNRLPVLEVNADPRTWRTAIDSLSFVIEGLLEQCYGQ